MNTLIRLRVANIWSAISQGNVEMTIFVDCEPVEALDRLATIVEEDIKDYGVELIGTSTVVGKLDEQTMRRFGCKTLESFKERYTRTYEGEH